MSTLVQLKTFRPAFVFPPPLPIFTIIISSDALDKREKVFARDRCIYKTRPEKPRGKQLDAKFDSLGGQKRAKEKSLRSENKLAKSLSCLVQTVIGGERPLKLPGDTSFMLTHN